MAGSACSESQMAEVLRSIPQKPPFLFIDRIIELSESHIVAERRFLAEEWYYAGHFPGDPVTPGVILLEAMAQASLVALGMHLIRQEKRGMQMRTLFTECSVEFFEVVRPGDRVTVHGEREFWRLNKLIARAELRLDSGVVAAAGSLAGMGVIYE